MSALSLNPALARLGAAMLLPRAETTTAAFAAPEQRALASNTDSKTGATLTTPLIEGATAQALAQADEPTAADKFLAEIKKPPLQRLREQILDTLGYTEASLDGLAPEQRAAVEDKIAKIIEEKLREAMRENGYETGGAQHSATAAAIEFIA